MEGICYNLRSENDLIMKVTRVSNELFGTSVSDLRSARGQEPIPSIRAIIFVYLRKKGLTFVQIGLNFGKDRSTAQHHLEKHSSRMETDPDYHKSYNTFIEAIEQKLPQKE